MIPAPRIRGGTTAVPSRHSARISAGRRANRRHFGAIVFRIAAMEGRMERLKILLADDQAIVRDGLMMLPEKDFDIVGAVEDGRALVQEAVRPAPDVVSAGPHALCRQARCDLSLSAGVPMNRGRAAPSFGRRRRIRHAR
jgi:hypothetical protein